MNHEEFQRAIGADPTHLNDALDRHLAHCTECVEYYADVLSLEARLRSALEISLPYRPLPPARDSPAVWWYGLAAAFALVTIADWFLSPDKWLRTVKAILVPIIGVSTSQ